jgi:hypothetical protein
MEDQQSTYYIVVINYLRYELYDMKNFCLIFKIKQIFYKQNKYKQKIF